MENTINLAEMANTADYSAMNYGQLLETKIAMLWAILKTNSLLENKRLVEMEKLTHDYVEAMNRYRSTKTETFGLLEKEEFWSDPTISFDPNGVDEQECVVANAIETENYQDKGEVSPAFTQSKIDVFEPIEPVVDTVPAIVESNREGAIEEEDCQTTIARENKEKTFVEKAVDVTKSIPINEDININVPYSVQVDITSNNGVTCDESVEKKNETAAIFEKAVEFARSLPIPADINVEHPYWVEQYICVSDDGRFSVTMNDIHNIKGKNASIDDIEKFKEYTEKYINSYYEGRHYTIFADDYMLIKMGDTIVVRLYCTSMVNSDASIQWEKSFDSTKKRKSKTQRLTENALKYAIVDVKNYDVPKSIDINTPYYVDYYFNYDDIKDRRWITKYLRCEGRNIEANHLDELKTLGDVYSKLYFGESAVLTSEDSLACVTDKNKITVRVYVNPAKEKDCNTLSKPVTIVEGIEVPIVYPEIVEAVKMAKEKPAPAGIDVDEPYYMQCNYDITSIGELVENGFPFASNVSADELKNHRKYHKLFAETKSSLIESADDYTAFIWNNNKKVSVFRYITKEKEAEP